MMWEYTPKKINKKLNYYERKTLKVHLSHNELYLC